MGRHENDHDGTTQTGDWLTVDELTAEIENARADHRHGNVWRDFDGNPVDPLSRREAWVVWGSLIALGAIWLAGLVWVAI